jgi:hypothetical protein
VVCVGNEVHLSKPKTREAKRSVPLDAPRSTCSGACERAQKKRRLDRSDFVLRQWHPNGTRGLFQGLIERVFDA